MPNYKCKNHFSIDNIRRIVERKQVKIVSFDLFDTLLVRPSMIPTDVFYLLEKRVQKEYGISFTALRLSVEQEMKNEHATIHDIWNWIARKNGLSLETAIRLMEMEIELETQVLTLRPDVYDVLRVAADAGKRIIIVSDMYLPGNILKEIIMKKGIAPVENVYVSCDVRKRKSSGELFEHVMMSEGIDNPSQVVHIGDNYASDYCIPLNRGITAVYYPSIWDDVKGDGMPWQAVYGNTFTKDPYMRLMCSFSILYTYLKRGRTFGEKRCFRNLEDMCSLYVGGMVSAIALDMLNRDEIQDQYRAIYFAARDGYLPKKIYDIFAQVRKGIPSRYLYVSRQALSYVTYDDFFDYFDKLKWGDEPYRLEDFLKLNIVDASVAEKILVQISKEEKEIDLIQCRLEGYEVLKRFESLLNEYFEKQAELSKRYYLGQFDEGETRHLVFDCGYSGSVSLGLGKACEQVSARFDKYYIWQADENKERDAENQTKTFCFDSQYGPIGLNIFYEECFSPFEGSCLGFVERQTGVVECVLGRMDSDEQMQKAMTLISETCVDYAHCCIEVFGKHLDEFLFTESSFFSQIGMHAFVNSPYMELSLLKPIRFVDSIMGGYPIELSQKVYNHFAVHGLFKDVFEGTQFRNPEMTISPKRQLYSSDKCRIGIHIHIHYTHIIEELVCYLEEFPLEFDLYITTTQSKSVEAIKGIFVSTLPNLRQITMITVANRGRDIAPWLVNTRKYQNGYDLFCHLHGKASVEYGSTMGDRWRKYLYDNLVEKEAVIDIINLFAENKKLGAVFPAYYNEVGNICLNNRIPLVGEFGEKQMIEQLMEKMGIKRLFSRDDMLYSAGTMLWYRPEAMKPLFDLGLKTEDFPEEPIPNGGTIAHAIERMPGLVCASCGYQAAVFNEVPVVSAPQIQMGIPMAPSEETPVFERSWRGHNAKWYAKKMIKSLVPYGILRVWQRIRYKF